MALSQSSKILVSDINTALAGKQDALGYTPVKSVNGTQADSSGNVAISVSAPVTSVNGMTGAVTISSVSSATTCPNVFMGNSGYLPSGGTWKCLHHLQDGAYCSYAYNTFAGGKQITSDTIAIRIA